MRRLSSALVAVSAAWIVLSLAPVARAATGPELDATPIGETAGERVFLEAWRIVGENFYDARMIGVDWEAVRDELLPRARAASGHQEISDVINAALGRLHASHTRHYIPEQREYWELLDIFNPEGVPDVSKRGGHASIPAAPVQYVGIGLVAKGIDGRVFAADVYEGGPAARAGIQVGDELVSVEGEPWGDVEPFARRDGLPTKMIVQRAADAATREEVVVVPAVIRPRELFLSAMRAGARVFGREGKHIAYVRIRSYAHPDYHDALKELLRGRFADADALVLDLRGGWGGASPEYMDVFNPFAPRMEIRNRDGKGGTVEYHWSKPVVMLIDGGTRSGKEVIAYPFKKHRVGTLVGERTAGAVLGGSIHPLSDGSIAMVAVADVRVDGQRLEGVGVEPDIAVPRRLPYCQGRDEQLEEALEEAVRMVGARP